MKKIILTLTMIFICAFAFAQKTVDLDSALSTVATEIATSLPSKSTFSVGKFFSDSKELSEFLANELTRKVALNGTLTLVERNTQQIDSELDYQYSGFVSNESMVELGYRLGVRYLAYGSFEQFGSMLQLNVQVTDVESGVVQILSSYSILPSAKITELLGDQKKLNSAEDYLNMIARCQKKLTDIQQEKLKEISKVSSSISAKYQEKINASKNKEKMPWESESEYQQSINTEVDKYISQRETELSGIEKSVGIKYDNQYKMIEIQMDKLTEDLQNSTFTINNDSVEIQVGAFNAEASPKYWPISIKSLSSFLNYTYSGKYTVNDVDVKSEYFAVEKAKADKSFVGEITYKLTKGSSKNQFNIFVLNVKIKEKNTGKTILNTQVNSEQGSIYATTENVSSSVQKNFNQFENSSVSKQPVPKTTVKTTQTSNISTSSVKSSDSIKLKNPEEFFLGKIKNKKSHNSMYLRGTMTKWDAGKSVKMQKIKDVRYGDSFVWYCDVFLQKGRYEFKFDVRNDWTISYGSDIGEVGINSVGKIFNVFNTFDVVNNLTIDIPYATTYRIRFNQSKMLCVVETVN